MNGQHLIALLNGRRVGVVSRDRQGRLKFEYDEDWRLADGERENGLDHPLIRRLSTKLEERARHCVNHLLA